MKFTRLAGFASAFSALSVSAVHAADGTWTSTTGGNWTDGTNWAGSAIADGTNFTANFTSDITADATVSLNGTNRTIGNIVFSDNGALGSAWIITGDQLNLAVGAGTPTITTTTNATIESVINGTQGLTKAGAGTLTLTGANIYAGTTNISGGKLALSGGDNRLATGGTINFTGNSTLDIGSTNQTLSSLTVGANNVTGTITGTGKLTLTGATSFDVTPTANSVSRTLNMSGLSNFEYNNNAGNFSIQALTGTAATGRTATVTLAASSLITANQVLIGTVGSGNTTNTDNAILNLGASTTINADTIGLGATQVGGKIGYASGTTNATLTIRGKDGISRAGTMFLGQVSNGTNGSGTVDLSTNVSGTGTLDAMITNLIIGQDNRNVSGGGTNTSGTFTMKGGTLDVTNMYIGLGTPGTSESGTRNVAGTFTSGTGGIVKVDTLKLADMQNPSGALNISATFNLNGGATLYAKNITPGGTGTLASTRTFNWNDGTIRNYDASTDLTIASGLNTFALLGAGTHAFDIDNGRTGTVNQNISGAGTGALTKNGNGTLIFTGTNTYSANTTVNAGTLRVNGANNGTGAVNVTGTGRLEGTGSIAGAVNVSGVLAPGASIESLRTGGVTLNNGATLAVEIQDVSASGADLLGVNGDLTLNGQVTLDLTKIGSGAWAATNKITIASYTGTWNGGLFTYGGNTLADGAEFTFDNTQWAIDYDDTLEGNNFAGDSSGTYVTMTVVPEPSVALLGGLGVLALLRRRRM